jgi:hypothetical protein
MAQASLFNRKRVAFRTTHGTYLCAWDDRSLRQAPHLREWECFVIVAPLGGDGSIRLLTAHGRYLQAGADGGLSQGEENADTAFWMLPVAGKPGRYALRTAHGTFLSAKDDRAWLMLAPHQRAWEEFELVDM